MRERFTCRHNGQSFLFGKSLRSPRTSSATPSAAPSRVNESVSPNHHTNRQNSRAHGDTGQGISTPSTSRRTNSIDKMGDAFESHPLIRRNLELLESGNFADAEIICICNGESFNVHKAILRSGCVWFDKAFANNWKEAQTGEIYVEGQQPELINELLKFIYTGQYSAELVSDARAISDPVLETNISMWETADYFLLPDLKTAIHDHLLDQMPATLVFFHSFKISRSIRSKNNFIKHDLDVFFADLLRAVRKVSEFPTARAIQKLFAVFVCGLREHLPAPVLKNLMKIRPFSGDMSSALVALHFTQATNGAVAQTLEESHMSSKKTTNCSLCGHNAGPRGESLDLVLDPFSSGLQKWCVTCARWPIRSRLETVVKEMA